MGDGKGKHLHLYSGAQARVTWDQRLCIHAGECGRAEGDLFLTGRDPWCDPDVASVEEVADVIGRCPTGALSFDAGTASPRESAAPENTVAVSENGPLYVRGDLIIDGAPADMKAVRFRAALCRCGQSKNKPFCDGSHKAAGFQSD